MVTDRVYFGIKKLMEDTDVLNESQLEVMKEILAVDEKSPKLLEVLEELDGICTTPELFEEVTVDNRFREIILNSLIIPFNMDKLQRRIDVAEDIQFTGVMGNPAFCYSNNGYQKKGFNLFLAGIPLQLATEVLELIFSKSDTSPKEGLDLGEIIRGVNNSDIRYTVRKHYLTDTVCNMVATGTPNDAPVYSIILSDVNGKLPDEGGHVPWTIDAEENLC